MTRSKSGLHVSSPDAVLRLWQEYKDSADPVVRNRLVLTLAPLVKYIVFRKLREIPARCEVEDFISCGLEAVIRSIDRYDPSKGATLEQFVWTRVHGAVIDELRRGDWAPRSLRRWERDINQARERFISLYGRIPTNSELGDALSISREHLLKLLDDIAKADVGSLNTLVVTEDDTTIEQIDTLQSADLGADPEYSAIREKAIERFRVAFSRLPVLDQEVALLLHVNGLKLREAGEILGISESRVCQIYGRLKRRLREQLDAEEQLFQEVA